MSLWLSSATSTQLVSWGGSAVSAVALLSGASHAHLDGCCPSPPPTPPPNNMTSSRVPSSWHSPRCIGSAKRLWPLPPQVQAGAVMLSPAPCRLPFGADHHRVLNLQACVLLAWAGHHPVLLVSRSLCSATTSAPCSLPSGTQCNAESSLCCVYKARGVLVAMQIMSLLLAAGYPGCSQHPKAQRAASAAADTLATLQAPWGAPSTTRKTFGGVSMTP